MQTFRQRKWYVLKHIVTIDNISTPYNRSKTKKVPIFIGTFFITTNYL